MIKTSALSALLLCVFTTCSFANFVDFGTQATNSPSWTAATPGVNVNFNSTYTGSPLWTPETKPFTNPAFHSAYGNVGSLIAVIAQGDQPNGLTNVSFQFAAPLSPDVRLVIMDLDGINERAKISSTSGPIAAPLMIESNDPLTTPAGASSFANWNPTNQILWSTATKHNDREAYVFDVSGLSDVFITIAADEPATSWIGLVTVPEPSSCGALLLGLLGFIARSRKR